MATNKTRNTIIGDEIEVADGSFTRMRGLLGRTALEPGGGLWIRPSSGVHTIGMKFSIDVVGLDKTLRVVRIWPRLVPFRLTSISFRVTSVLELPAGQIDSSSIRVGDQLSIQTS